ncbi:RidA family protein [Clostridium aquiflavi]|uniref:RidA family protein n=1 Tax=Clostridium aquiflavi TaxID=3073603 RepID=A0ABU1EEU6_9CLOT|nr:RidA family protein [Clostridium sp. 5N-1]MDR5586799.1 RidA family protein [Clostridium sp. 5N-1]
MISKQKIEKIKRVNPSAIPPPVGKYSHITKIPKDAEIFVTSGQVGVGIDNNIPESINDQVKNTFKNIANLLASQQLSADNVIKVNIWATEEIDWNYLYGKWDSLFGTEYPSMTIAYISALGLPELKIEIELWAAK